MLVLLVAAAVGYLVVRERMRATAARQQTAEAARRAEQEAELSKPGAKYNSNLTTTARTEYAPLRDRVVTNTVRVPSNRFIGVPGVTSAPTVVGVGETRPYRNNDVQTVSVGSSPVFPGGGGRSGGASVMGRVLLHGTPPPEKVVTLDAMCGRLHPTPMTTRHYVTGPGGTLADVLVYVKAGAPSAGVPAGLPTPLLDQVNCEYVPYVIGVQAGQKLVVRNSDPALHNVHTLPKVPGNRERNIGQPVKGSQTEFMFEKPEIFVQLKCDVHPWMFAYIGVVDSPWFAVTDGNGSFTLPSGLPPGQYTLAAVHRKLGEQTQTILVGANGSEPVTFTLEVPEP